MPETVPEHSCAMKHQAGEQHKYRPGNEASSNALLHASKRVSLLAALMKGAITAYN